MRVVSFFVCLGFLYVCDYLGFSYVFSLWGKLWEEIDSLTLVYICVRWCGGLSSQMLVTVLCHLLASRAEFCLWSNIMWWQEPCQLGQLRCALSSSPNLAFVQMHVEYLAFVSQNKLTGILQGCLQGVQTWVLFESSQNLGILFSWHLLGSRSVKYTKNCLEQSEPRQELEILTAGWESRRNLVKGLMLGPVWTMGFCQSIVGLVECWWSMQMKYSDI